MPTGPLPEGLLLGPGPEIVKQKIDFLKTPLPFYEGMYAVILDNVLSAEECAALIKAAEDLNEGVWEQAMVNMGGDMQMLDINYRKSGRIIWDSPELADRLWSRILPYLASDIATGDDVGVRYRHKLVNWSLSRLNERMRFLRYEPGDYFEPHGDGSYGTPDNTEVSFVTLHLYLNDATTPGNEMFKGGATPFHSPTDRDIRYDVECKTGRVLVFTHPLLHSGDKVRAGTKYSMRTDIMYKRGSLKEEQATTK